MLLLRVALIVAASFPSSSLAPRSLARPTAAPRAIMSSASSSSDNTKKNLSRPDLIRKLLQGIETGDPESASVVNEDVYIQHNPQTKEGGEGLAALFSRLSKSNPKVNIVRAFPDGDYVFGHVEYQFGGKDRVGFELFRFDEGTNQAVEHWDNIQPKQGTDRSMVSGPTEAQDLERTEDNRRIAASFVQEVLIPGNNHGDAWKDYVHADVIQHAPYIPEHGRQAWLTFLTQGDTAVVHSYDKLHRVLACGNFCMTVTEGKRNDVPTSFYDLFRFDQQGIIVEHWDTIEAVPPESEWKNQNGKF